MIGLGLWQGPDKRSPKRAMRHQRQWPAWQKPLIGNIGVIAFERQIGNNGGLPMRFGQAADTGKITQFAFRAITSNNQLAG